MLQFLGAIRIARFMDERQEGMQQERNHQLANSLFLLLRPPDNSDTSAVQLAVSDAGCVDMALRILPTVERREDVSNLLVVLVHLLRGEHTSTRIVQRMLAASPAADVLNIFFGIIVQQTRLFRNAPLHTLDFGPRSACFTIICLILQAAGDAIPAILITDAVREAFVANLKIANDAGIHGMYGGVHVSGGIHVWHIYREHLFAVASLLIRSVQQQQRLILAQQWLPWSVTALNTYLGLSAPAPIDNDLCLASIQLVGDVALQVDIASARELFRQQQVRDVLWRLSQRRLPLYDDILIRIIHQYIGRCLREWDGDASTARDLVPWLRIATRFMDSDNLGQTSKRLLLITLRNMFVKYEYIKNELRANEIAQVSAYCAKGMQDENWEVYDDEYRTNKLMFLHALVNHGAHSLTHQDMQALRYIRGRTSTTAKQHVFILMIIAHQCEAYSKMTDKRNVTAFLQDLLDMGFVTYYMRASVGRQPDMQSTIRLLGALLLVFDAVNDADQLQNLKRILSLPASTTNKRILEQELDFRDALTKIANYD